MNLLIKWVFIFGFTVFNCAGVMAGESSVSSVPRNIVLKPNATEGYAQTMRTPPVVEVNTDTMIIILPPLEIFREMEIFLDPLSNLFFDDDDMVFVDSL
ncbi:MAG: hypothetical protein ACXITR_00040 [Cyanobacterium sp.]